ncbi:MAG: hypothetical protein IPO22_15415 [Anaerolineales bacterium]|nr:hypothetical protein [Anaerolineales bacterium]
MPALWIDNALLAGTELPAPVDPNGVFTSAGTVFGLGFGLAWIVSLGGYQATGPVWMRARIHCASSAMRWWGGG